MEDLNKNQIVLLTLLISFVTSIATGIMTVSLLQEAPLEITRNINRIVEKTIETVTPANVTAPQKEVTTVVVKEEDLIIESINKNIKSIVRIKEKDPALPVSTFYGMGLVASKDGLIAADRKTISTANKYTVTMNDDTEFVLIPTGIEKQTNFILFKVVIPEKADPKNPYVFVPASFSDTEPKLGQTLISIGGESENAVSVGRVISLGIKDSGVGTSTVKVLTDINTDLPIKDIFSGIPVFNLSGDVVGVKLTLDSSKSFTPISVLKKEIVALTEALAPKAEVPKTP